MEEVVFKVSKEKGGWYKATADYKGGSILVEGEDFTSLKQKVLGLTAHHLSVCRNMGIDIPANPRIRLTYTESLSSNPQGMNVLVTGFLENNLYRALAPGLELDLSHKNLDGLREALIHQVQGYQDKRIEFTLEEVLELEPSNV